MCPDWNRFQLSLSYLWAIFKLSLSFIFLLSFGCPLFLVIISKFYSFFLTHLDPLLNVPYFKPDNLPVSFCPAASILRMVPHQAAVPWIRRRVLGWCSTLLSPRVSAGSPSCTALTPTMTPRPKQCHATPPSTVRGKYTCIVRDPHVTPPFNVRIQSEIVVFSEIDVVKMNDANAKFKELARLCGPSCGQIVWYIRVI